MKKIIYILIVFVVFGCAKEEAVPVVVDFEYEVFNNDFSIPVQIVFFNRTVGGEEYIWTFEGGVPSRSTNRSPGVVQYDKKGTYSIELFATNQDGETGTKTIEIQIDAPVVIDFEIENLVDNFSPAVYKVVNRSQGATNFNWTFEGGIPASSTEEDPGDISFNDPGDHIIRLEISNGRENFDLEKTITVAPFVVSDFNSQVAFEDDDFQIPVRIQFENISVSATSYQWSFEGANITTSSEENPEVIFNEVGVHTITLTVTNGKETKVTSKTIEIFPDTNLRVLENIRFGINTAHNTNTVGSFYNIKDREVYTADEISAGNSNSVDLVFFGLNQSFTENFFTSPNKLSETSFIELLNPKQTIFINSQELDNRPGFLPLTTSQFDAMMDDTALNGFIVEETVPGSQPFDNSTTPRIVLFQTQEGTKGAIKIKEYIEDGQNSFVIVDIKVQKQPK